MNLPAQAFQYASFVDSNGRTNTNSHDALAVFRCVNDECHGTLTKHQPYTGSDLLGGVMAQEPLAAANVSMLRRVIYRKARREGPANVQSQSSRAFSFFKGRLASAAQHASIQQAIVPCIMLQMAHGFGWAALGKDQVPRFIFAARFGSVQLHYPRFIAFDIAIIFTTGHCGWHLGQRAYSTSCETVRPQNGFYVHETETRVGR